MRLQEAVDVLRSALEERTRERVPLDWAVTTHNLANALGMLGWDDAEAARLEQAVELLDEAVPVLEQSGATHHVELARRSRALFEEAILRRRCSPAQ